MISNEQYQEMLASYFKRGGSIERLPPAVGGVALQVPLPDDDSRSALRRRAQELKEGRKQAAYPLRRELRDEKTSTSPPELPVVRERLAEMGRKSQAYAKERKTQKAKETGSEMNLDGRGTTRNKMSFLEAGQEVTKYTLKDGRTEVHSRDHSGRLYIVNFSPTGRYLGSKQVAHG